jgi:hypothetical protein
MKLILQIIIEYKTLSLKSGNDMFYMSKIKGDRR